MLEKYFADGEVYGFNLSESEIRLVVKESPKGISMTVKPLTTSYARYFNRTHNITGKLFNGRFTSIPIESEEEKRSFIDGLASGGKEIKSAGRVKPRKIKSVSDPQARDTKKETGDTKTDLSTEKTKKKKMPSYLL